MKIGIIGTGVIATATVEGMVADGHQITVSERSAKHSAYLAAKYENVAVANNQQVVDASDVIFIGLMAEQAGAILSVLDFRADQKIISLMAGPTLAEIAQMVSPAIASANMIPFPSIATGGSAILVLGDATIPELLFGTRNRIFKVASDAEMSAYLAAQAVLSPAALLVHQAGAWLGQQVADPEQGEAFLRELVGSSLLATPNCDQLIKALSTPGGYNQRLREHMETAGMGAALDKGLSAL